MYDVLTIGSGTRDAFLISSQFQLIKSKAFKTGVGECVSLGSKIEIEDLVLTTGGGATNAAATFSRLGYKSGVICRVGDDSTGRELILELQREGLVTTLIERVPNGRTGYSTLLTDAKTGERTVLVYRGVSSSFTKDSIPWEECQARWFYLTSLGGNVELSARIAKHVHAQHAGLTWNPGSSELKRGFAALRTILRHVRILILNKEEAQMLTGTDDLSKMFAILRAHDAVVLITDGERGSYAHHHGTTWFAHTTGRSAISRTGAGDAFGSAFTAAYMQDEDVAQALQIATLNADSVIQHVGAKTGILTSWPSINACKSIKVETL